MISRYFTTLSVAMVLAAVAIVAAIVAQPKEAGAADTVSVRGCTGTNVVLDVAEKKSLDLHNEKRADRGLGKLCVHPALQRSAEKHSRDMMNRNYFDHDTEGSGATFAQRIKREGYGYRTAGENIAWGSGSYGTPESILRSWMKSSGHRKNILNKSYREVGIGVSDPGRYQGYQGAVVWTADFGARR